MNTFVKYDLIALTAILVILLGILILRKPIKKLIKKCKAKREEKKKRKESKKAVTEEIKKVETKKELPLKEKVKVKKKIIKKKFFHMDLKTPLFTIIGVGILLSAILTKTSFFTLNYTNMQNFFYKYLHYHIATTILITLILSALLWMVSTILEDAIDKKHPALKSLYILVMSVLTAGVFFTLTQSLASTNTSTINVIIMGALFLLIGFGANFKRLFKTTSNE